MLSKEKQKAIIEAMLFVSTQPLPVSKIVRKLRQVIRQQQKLESQNEAQDQNEENQDEQVLEAGSEVVVDEMTDAEVLEASDDVSEHKETDLENEELADVIDQISAESDAQNDNQTHMAGEEVVDGENQNTESEEQETELEAGSEIADEDVDSDEDAGDDVMAQLMQKQQELDEEITAADVKVLIREMEEAYAAEDRGLELVAVARGYQVRTKYDVSLFLKDEKVKAPQRFSPSSLETLAIVAYQQPITRIKVEEIRGVDSGGVMKTLLDKGILRIVGRSEEAGKPLIYGTSGRFLEIFGLQNLKDMPSLQDYHGLQMSQDQDDLVAEEVYPENGINVDDLLCDDISELSEAEQAVLDDLDSSLIDLKKVEKDVLHATNPEPEVEEGEEVAVEVQASESQSGVDAQNISEEEGLEELVADDVEEVRLESDEDQDNLTPQN